MTDVEPAEAERAPLGERHSAAGPSAMAPGPGVMAPNAIVPGTGGTPSGGRSGRSGNWTTRRWLAVGASASLAVLLIMGVTGGWVFARSSRISNRLVDVSTPALVDSVRLEAALTDQETGARGYGLTGQTSFLDPYVSGLQDQKKAVAELDALLPGNASARAELTRLLARAEVWQARFARPVAAAPPGAPVALATERADEGKKDFDAVRAESARLQSNLQDDRDRARADLNQARSERNWIFAVIAAIILALTALIFVALRRGVTMPLQRLSDDVRAVTEGDFEHRVNAVGPADLRRLARAVDAMRARLSEELAFSNATRERMDEQTADLQRSNAELEQFAYVASHDLQEPLRKVASFCQLLQRRYGDKLDDRAGQYIEYAVDGATRMQTLINDLLAFSRVGRLHNGSATVDMEELFGRTSDALSIAVEESGATITHDTLPKVLGDPTQLGIIVQNLLSNALKFRAPERAAEVSMTVRGADGMWHFAVADNGIGIPEEYADKVFVIFQRLHTREAYPGNGIGLALCKKIVEFHGGTIGIDPEHAPGTRITFSLPQLPDADGTPGTATTVAPATPAATEPEETGAAETSGATEAAGTGGTGGAATTAEPNGTAEPDPTAQAPEEDGDR